MIRIIKILLIMIFVSNGFFNCVFADEKTYFYGKILSGNWYEFAYLPAKDETKGVVILLHGLGGSGKYFLEPVFSDLIKKNREKGIAFILPSAINSSPNGISSNFGAWNGGASIRTDNDCCFDLYSRYLNYLNYQMVGKLHQPFNEKLVPNDLKAIDELASFASSALGVPRKKFILLGISNGGIMAYRVQCSLPPGSFGAIVSIQGTLTGVSNCEGGAANNFGHIHGDKDSVVPFIGGVTNIAPLFPKFIFERSVKQSFNQIAIASNCLFGIDGEKSIKNNGYGDIKNISQPYVAELDWVLNTAVCNNKKALHLLTYVGAGHDFRLSMFKIGLNFGVDSILTN